MTFKGLINNKNKEIEDSVTFDCTFTFKCFVFTFKQQTAMNRIAFLFMSNVQK